MSDFNYVLPAFNPSNPRLHALFESHQIPSSLIVHTDPADLSRQCKSKHCAPPSVSEIRHYVAELAAFLHADTQPLPATRRIPREACLTTGDETIDTLLGGGIPLGPITEFVGESGAGKTQFLMTLCLTCQLPPLCGGLGRSAIYISTQAPLPTQRVLQICDSINSRFSVSPAVTTDRILSITCNDLESQDHIMRYQLPVAVERNNVGLIVVDSIAANFRAEFDLPAKRIKSRPGKTPNSGAMNMAMRGKQLVGLARGLKELARRFGLAVVVANQVADRFPRGWADADDLSLLDYQSRYFTGWEEVDGGKVPALGMVWANLLGGRNALLKGEERDGRPRTRNIMVVFSECAQGGKKVEFEIWEGGVRGVKKEKGEEKTTIYG